MASSHGTYDHADLEAALERGDYRRITSVVVARGDATYEWYAGQGKILHGVSAEAAAIVDDYLRQASPLSRGLYKYLRFRAVK